MNGSVILEDLENLLESFDDYEWDESDEFEEASPLKRIRPMKAPAAAKKSSYQARPSQYVTQAQLQATSTRLDGKISAISKETVQQINTVKKEQAKQIALLKKEVTDRKKEAESAKKDLRQLRDMSALLPLISRPSSHTLTEAAGGLPAGSKILVDKDDTFSMLLPLMLLGGLGGSSSEGGGGGMFGGGDSMMPIVLLLALGKK